MTMNKEQLARCMNGFHKTILNKIVNEPYESVSCSAWDTKRSAYTQLAQFYLVDKKTSDKNIMKKILPLSVPCLSGTCTPTGHVWIHPKHKYLVCRDSLNGWAPQNHMDCAAAAAAGAINASLGIPRGSPAFVTVHDVVNIMKLWSQREILDYVENFKMKNPKVNLEPFYESLLNNLHSEEQPRTGEDNREDTVDFDDLMSKIFKDSKKEFKKLKNDYNFCSILYFLKSMRMVEARAGYYPLEQVINQSGFPLTAKVHEGYTWNELKTWIAEPGTSVIAYIPRHAVLIFGVGETKEGKYRHALIGRASGGQTPSSWIPFEERDCHKDESFWYPGGKLGQELNPETATPLYLTNKSRRGQNKQVAVVVKWTKETEYIPDPIFSDFTPPPWLQSRELLCDSCALHKQRGDSVAHPKERIQWIQSILQDK